MMGQVAVGTAGWRRILGRVLLLGMLALAGLALAGPTRAANAPLGGFVVEPSRIPGVPGMMPLEGATVTIEGTRLSDRTGANGAFQIPGAPSGELTVHVTCPGYTPVTRRVTVRGPFAPENLVILLKPEGTKPMPAFSRQSVYVAFADEDWFKASPIPRPMTNIGANLSYLGEIFWGANPVKDLGPAVGDATPISAARNVLLVFDPAKPQKISYIEVPVPPFWLAFGGSGERLFVASAYNTIHVYDVTENKAVAQVRCAGPVVDLVRSGDHVHALVMGARQVLALDGRGRRVATMPLEGQGRPQALAADPNGGRLYVSLQVGQGGEIRAFDGTRPIATVRTPAVPLGMALTPDGRFLIAPDSRTAVTVRDASTLQPVAAFPVGIMPCRVAVSPDSTRAWVSCRGSGAVHVIDLRTMKPAGIIDVDAEPMGMAVTSDGARLYVACRGKTTVCAIDTDSGKVVGRTTPQPLGKPTGVTVRP